MSDAFDQDDNVSTPLEDEEKADLIPSYIATREELNEAEQANIIEASAWAFSSKRDVLGERFLDGLHKRMFGKVWRWAGTHRTSAKTIGIDAYRIPTEMRQMIDDCRYWLDHDTYSVDEIATRFHHRLVWVHPYPNGNGRHARLATDLLLVSLGAQSFSWGRHNLVDASETRQRYVAALRAADNHDFGPLMVFVRS